MKKHIAAYLDNAISLVLLVVAGLTPLLFFNQTTEFFEMPKLTLLVVATILLYGMWIFNCILKGKVAITRTPLDIPLLMLLVVVLLSTFFSETRYVSIYGNFPRIHGSAVSWVTYILLYFVTVSNLRSLTHVRTLLYVLYGSAVVTSLVSIASFFGGFLPFDFAKAVNFTPTGSSFSTVAFLLMMLPLPLVSLLNKNKYVPAPFAMALAILFSFTVALLGSVNSVVALFLVYAMVVFATKPQQLKRSFALFAVPVVVTVVTLMFAYVPSMPLHGVATNFPREIQLPFGVSWKISASSFRDAPFVGTGPSTYLFNFTSYKPLEFNTLSYWNFSFDSAYNEFLQVLGTLGILGFVALLVLSLVVLVNSKRNMVVNKEVDHAQVDGVYEDAGVMLPALAISAITSVVLLFTHATTLVSFVVTMFVFAALMMSQRVIRSKVMLLSMGLKASTGDNRQFDLFPVIVFIVFLFGAVPALVTVYNVVAADYYHRQALTQANKNGTLTYQNLQKAESLNPYIDLYRVDMAQTNFALANALAAQKGPSKENPKGSLTDQDRKTIQTLLSQAINESRASVALSPRSSRNWEVLASIYRNISGVAQNALVYSLDSYGRAIQRDPLNPTLRINVGGIYYTVKNYDNAIRFFSDAANLKPDYANAYFNLAIALREKGDFVNAKAVSEQTVRLLSKNPNTPDYKVAKKLDEELQAKVANGQKATATASGSALQNPEVGQVDVNTQQAPSITPAPTVRPNPAANLPQNTRR